MEITKLFKACVKAAKLKTKEASNILPKSRKNQNGEKSFHCKATDLVRKCTLLTTLMSMFVATNNPCSGLFNNS